MRPLESSGRANEGVTFPKYLLGSSLVELVTLP